MANVEYNVTTTEQPAALVTPGLPHLNTLIMIGGPTVAVILAISVLLYVQGQSLNSFVRILVSALRKLDNDKIN